MVFDLAKNRSRSTQGHNLTKYDGPEYQVSLKSFLWLRGLSFSRVFTIYGHGGHLGHVTGIILINFHLPKGIHTKFG